MATITQSDLANRVLQYLKVSEGGESPAAEDTAIVDLAIVDLYAELEEKKLAYWPLTAIPNAVVRGLVRMVGADCCESFVNESEVEKYEGRRRSGEMMIRAALDRGSDHDTVPHLYF